MDKMIITSRKNPLVAELAEIAKNPPSDRALCEGPHLCEEAFFKSQLAIHGLYLTEAAAETPAGREILNAAEKRAIRVTFLSPDCYAKITQLNAPEGMACVVTPLTAALEEILARPAVRLLVAAGVQDPGNAGALARLAEAAGADAVLYAGSVNPRKGKFLRAAMGSAFRLPCVATSADALLPALKSAGIPLIVAAKTEQSTDYRSIPHQDRFALAVGAEGLGVPEGFRQAADITAHLPMAGQVESLNVSVAAGIMLYRLTGLG